MSETRYTPEQQRAMAATFEMACDCDSGPRMTASCSRCRKTAAMLRQAATDAELARVCVWTPGEDGVWHTTCRNAFVTEDGGTAAQHGFKFCCYCGGTLTEGTAK